MLLMTFLEYSLTVLIIEPHNSSLFSNKSEGVKNTERTQTCFYFANSHIGTDDGEKKCFTHIIHISSVMFY